MLRGLWKRGRGGGGRRPVLLGCRSRSHLRDGTFSTKGQCVAQWSPQSARELLRGQEKPGACTARQAAKAFSGRLPLKPLRRLRKTAGGPADSVLRWERCSCMGGEASPLCGLYPSGSLRRPWSLGRPGRRWQNQLPRCWAHLLFPGVSALPCWLVSCFVRSFWLLTLNAYFSVLRDLLCSQCV